MQAISNHQLAQIHGGGYWNALNAVGIAVTVIASSQSLNSFGRGLGSGIYDALHKAD